jgi:hypothetical protein
MTKARRLSSAKLDRCIKRMDPVSCSAVALIPGRPVSAVYLS